MNPTLQCRDKILKPGLQILVVLEAELGLPAGQGWSQLGHFPLPSLPLGLGLSDLACPLQVLHTATQQIKPLIN